MKKPLIFGGVSFNTMLYFDRCLSSVLGSTCSADRFYETVGSTGAGKALALSALDLDVMLYGIIGNDTYGEKIKSLFDTKNIPFYYDIDEKGTERHVNIMEYPNDRRTSMFIHSPMSNISLNFEVIEELVKKATVVFLNIADHCRRVIPVLKKYNVPIWCDLHSYDGAQYYDDFIACADVIMFSSDKLDDYESHMHDFITLGKKMVICTHGKHGASIMITKKEIKHYEAIKINEVTDTNGAGDNFLSGFYYGLFKGYSVDVSMKIAAIMGHAVIQTNELVSELVSEQFIVEQLEKKYGIQLS